MANGRRGGAGTGQEGLGPSPLGKEDEAMEERGWRGKKWQIFSLRSSEDGLEFPDQTATGPPISVGKQRGDGRGRLLAHNLSPPFLSHEGMEEIKVLELPAIQDLVNGANHEGNNKKAFAKIRGSAGLT